MANTQPKLGLAEAIESGEQPDYVVDVSKDLTLKRALKVLDGRAKPDLKIAGQRVDNPKEAYAKLQEALKLVKTYFKKNLKIDLNDLKFRQFHGDMVGESTKEGTYVDPVMLMHPAMRLAHVIAHELAHRNKAIMNEGLVEGYVDQWFGHDGANHGYEASVEKFKEVAKKCDKKGDVKTGTETLYELYYKGKFEGIYELYEENYMNGLKTVGEKQEAFRLFKEVFPELDYVVPEEKAGYFNLKKLPQRNRAENDNVEEGEEMI